jgi:hypothetical protein
MIQRGSNLVDGHGGGDGPVVSNQCCVAESNRAVGVTLPGALTLPANLFVCKHAQDDHFALVDHEPDSRRPCQHTGPSIGAVFPVSL